jgi:hypothetical protein
MRTRYGALLSSVLKQFWRLISVCLAAIHYCVLVFLRAAVLVEIFMS